MTKLAVPLISILFLLAPSALKSNDVYVTEKNPYTNIKIDVSMDTCTSMGSVIMNGQEVLAKIYRNLVKVGEYDSRDTYTKFINQEGLLTYCELQFTDGDGTDGIKLRQLRNGNLKILKIKLFGKVYDFEKKHVSVIMDLQPKNF